MTDNPDLTDITMLHGVMNVWGGVRITGNTSLGDDAAWAFVDAVNVEGTVVISGN